MSVILDNPLPSSTGRVCQHPCDSRCRRQTIDEAVNMREVHRFIADSIYLSDRYEEMVERIVGRADSNPLVAKSPSPVPGLPDLPPRSTFRCSGHEVTVYDGKAEAGGMLRFALPEYRLPKAVLAQGNRSDRTSWR